MAVVGSDLPPMNNEQTKRNPAFLTVDELSRTPATKAHKISTKLAQKPGGFFLNKRAEPRANPEKLALEAARNRREMRNQK